MVGYGGCASTKGSTHDYWVGAKIKCNTLNKMHLTSKSELKDIYKFKCSSSYNPNYNYSTCVSEVPTSGYFWASDTYDNLNAYEINFAKGSESHCSMGSQNNILCVGN